MKGRGQTPLGLGPALLALLLSAGGTAHADDWSALGLAPSRTRLSAERSGTSFGAGGWAHRVTDRQQAYRALVASPAVADGYVVFATPANLIRALRESDGQPLWQVPGGDSNVSSPAIWRGLALVLGADQKLTALRLSDGGTAWSRTLGGIGYSSPIVVDDSLYVAAGNPSRRVLRIDAATGEIRWQAGQGVLRQSPFSSLAVADGQVIAGEMGGRYHSFAAEDGRWQWTVDTGGEIYLSSALVVGGRAYLLAGGDKLRMFAVDLATGAALAGWPREIPLPVEAPGAARLLAREHIVSSCAGDQQLITFSVRVEDRLDSDGDGAPDSYRLRQHVLAMDGNDGRVLWSAANGRLDSRDVNAIPTGALIGTPALYRGGRGEILLAVTSSLSAELQVLTAADGALRWSTTLAGTSRSSPVMANGRLLVTTDAGVVQSFVSSANQPPIPSILGLAPTRGQETDAAGTTLRWGAAFDRQGGTLRYEVRVDDDGEILRDWDFQATTTGQQALQLPSLPAGRVYTFRIRARDPQGAYSPWTSPETFRTVASPAVEVDGQPAQSLTEAVARAQPGVTIRLGAGVFRLSSPLQLPPGTALAGAGPHLTTLDARGLAVGVAPGAGSGLEQLTVSGARVGVQVASPEVRLQNVILRDNQEAGLDVAVDGSAQLINGTLVRNGAGARARGALQVRNSLVTANELGLVAADVSLLTSRYNDVYGNRADDYRNVNAGGTDLSLKVAFASAAADDGELRLQDRQPSTDRGDPGDDYSREPAPNGGRINIGAFGNTPFAELSGAPVSTTPSDPPTSPAPADGTSPGSDPGTGARARGGGCALASPGNEHPDGALLLVLGALLLIRRRR